MEWEEPRTAERLWEHLDQASKRPWDTIVQRRVPCRQKAASSSPSRPFQAPVVGQVQPTGRMRPQAIIPGPKGAASGGQQPVLLSPSGSWEGSIREPSPPPAPHS